MLYDTTSFLQNLGLTTKARNSLLSISLNFWLQVMNRECCRPNDLEGGDRIYKDICLPPGQCYGLRQDVKQDTRDKHTICIQP